MASGNTVTLQTDLNTDPYYDDFDESKNFHRILFRPGLAVQGRELTQLQTILQNQVDRFGEHIFREGSVVSGCELNYDRRTEFVRLRDNDSGAVSVNVTNFVGASVTGGTSGVSGLVINSADGLEANSPDTKTLYIAYTSSGTDGVTQRFTNGEVITANTGFTANVISSSATGFGSSVTIGEGIIFAKDHFVRVPAQTVVVGKYNSNVSVKVGYEMTESIISSVEDTTLLDPARGSFNFNAPGADRLRINPVLSVIDIDADTSEDFVEFIRVRNGEIEFSAEKPAYSQINDYIARRTFEESGNYIVEGLTARIREHLNQNGNQGVFTVGEGGDSELLSVDVSPGVAYIYGYRQENLTTAHVAVEKGLEFNSLEQLRISTNYGNYVPVNEVTGVWDVNQHGIVELRDQAMNAVSNNQFSSTAPVGNVLGTARVKAIELNQGTPGDASAEYNLYLYDIAMSNGAFTDVRSVYLNNSSQSDPKADVSLVANNAVLVESAFNRSVFGVPARFVRRIRDVNGQVDTTFRFLKEFDVTVATDGTFTVLTGVADEQFPFGTGVLNDTQVRENFHLILNADATSTVNMAGTFSISSGTNQVTGSGTIFTGQINPGDVIDINTLGEVVVASVEDNTNLTIHGTAGSTVSGQTANKVFKAGQYISLDGLGTAASRSVNIVSSTSAAFDIEETLASTVSATVICELSKVDGQEIVKQFRSSRLVKIDVDNNTAGVNGPWNLGFSDIFQIRSVRRHTSDFANPTDGTDVTADFILDNGQTDNLYQHGRLQRSPTSSLVINAGDWLLVELDYFQHDTSQGVGYFSVDSYPIDDTNAANTAAITTQEIPVFTSPVSGDVYSLRDTIDIRPRISDTATDAIVVGSASTNPVVSTTITEPSGGLHYSPPNDNFIVDLDYYLPRMDRIIYDSAGKFRAIKGVSSLTPTIPPEPNDGMTIATVIVSPFPSLPPEIARNIGREELQSTIQPVRIQRYRMQDINTLEERIDDLEYYTSLSLLENDAMSFSISDEDGLERFKNGILVDNFQGHSVSDILNPDYSVSMDSDNNEVRPSFIPDQVGLVPNLTASNNVTRRPSDTIVTIDGTDTFTVGETVSSSGGGSGTLTYQVGRKLYLEDVDTSGGNFTVSGTVSGGQSGSGGTITAVQTVPDGAYITFPYSHDRIIEQPFASTTRNTAGLAYSWIGELELSPSEDIWVETIQAPAVNININNTNNGWIGAAGGQFNQRRVWGRNWGWWRGWGWNWRWVGWGVRQWWRPDVEAVNTVDRQSLGTQVINTEVLPFIRSQVIRFTGTALKPSTRFYPFFDGDGVAEHCRPTDSSFANTASYGSDLVTDSQGNIYGEFLIPNNDQQQFRTGTLSFRLTDNVSNSEEIGSVTSSAEENFTASGIRQEVQETIVSTRRTTFRRRVRVDPVAQSFRVEDDATNLDGTSGIFLSKIDLFFASKDDTLPVIVEIRQMDPSTAFVTNDVIPLSRQIVPSADVNISDDGSAPTPIFFNTPIFLQTGTDYAIVVKPGGGNPNYSIFISRLGETDLITGGRIGSNPYSGILFASANDRTWTPIQEEDFKFNVYFANFGTAQSGTLRLENPSIEYLTVDTASAALNTVGEVVHGETTLTLSAGPTANVGEVAVGATSAAEGTITNINGTAIRLSDVTLAEKFANGETINYQFANGQSTGVSSVISSQSVPVATLLQWDAINPGNIRVQLDNSNGLFDASTQIRGQSSGTTANITTISQLNTDMLNIYLGRLEIDGVAVVPTARLATSPTGRDTSPVTYAEGSDVVPSTRRFILSRSQEVAGLSGNKSVEFTVNLTNSLDQRHSPVIDVEKMGYMSVENIINNDSTGEDSANGGNAVSRYITRTVTLADGQDAEDLRLLLTAYKPPTAEIKAYYKILNSADSDVIEDRDWVEFQQSTLTNVTSDQENPEDFIEFEWSIPTSELTGINSSVQYTNSQTVTFTGFKFFKIKLVLLSSSFSNVPRARDLRCIALQR